MSLPVEHDPFFNLPRTWCYALYFAYTRFSRPFHTSTSLDFRLIYNSTFEHSAPQSHGHTCRISILPQKHALSHAISSFFLVLLSPHSYLCSSPQTERFSLSHTFSILFTNTRFTYIMPQALSLCFSIRALSFLSTLAHTANLTTLSSSVMSVWSSLHQEWALPVATHPNCYSSAHGNASTRAT